MPKMKIKKNDEVIVLTGKDKGKKGKVITALPAEHKVVVAGVNQVQRHRKADAQGNKAGIITKNLPTSLSLTYKNFFIINARYAKYLASSL